VQSNRRPRPSAASATFTVALSPASASSIALRTDRASASPSNSREEEGTVRYRASESLTEPGTIHFFEQYDDRAAAEQHTESSVYQEFAETLPEFVEGDLETIQSETDEVEIFEYSAADAT
jgi:quinol monooxygenase YgiN